MSKKHKNKGSGQQASSPLLQQARRQLGKGDARQALKDAKVLFRREPSDAHRELLEEAYAARVAQLHQAGMPEQARAALGELTALGARSPAVQAQAARLRLLLGLAADGRSQAIDAVGGDVQVVLADDAVVHPERIAHAYAQIKEQADQVRQALQLVEAGDDAAGAALLRDVSRASPFADWRLLVRGLSAHYAGDAARRDANWARLDAGRAPHRIATTLLVASGAKDAGESGLDMTDRLRRLSLANAAHPAQSLLKEMAGHFQARDDNGLLRAFRTLTVRFRATHPELVAKVTDLLWKAFVRERRWRTLEEFWQSATPPPLDPDWHRARALFAEGDVRHDLNTVEDAWNAYSGQLPRLTALREEERGIAAGLVNLRLARFFLDAAKEEKTRRESRERFLHDESDEDNADYENALRSQAEHYIKESLRHCPRLLAAHRELVRLQRAQEKPDAAVAAAKELLRHFPDDFDTWTWLAAHHLELDQPAEARSFVREVERLRPRAPETRALLWNQRLAMVRFHVRKRKFDLARSELEAIASTSLDEQLTLDSVRAAVEYKAGQLVEAQQQVRRAVARLREDTVVWLRMHVVAIRYKLSRELRNEFAERFRRGLKRPALGETAARMASTLTPFLANGVSYTGLVTHLRAVRTYLGRCGRVAWRAEELRVACEFVLMDERWGDKRLRQLTALARVGCRRFPRDPHFQYFAGLALFGCGPWSWHVGMTITHLEESLRLNAQTDTPLSPHHESEAKRVLSILNDYRDSPGSDDFFDDDDEDDDDEDDFAEDDDFDDSPFAGADENGEDGEDGDDEDIRRAAGRQMMLPGMMRMLLERFAKSHGMSVEELLAQLKEEGVTEEMLADIIGSAALGGGSRAGRSRKSRAR